MYTHTNRILSKNAWFKLANIRSICSNGTRKNTKETKMKDISISLCVKVWI